jgi:hypothetical protein
MRTMTSRAAVACAAAAVGVLIAVMPALAHEQRQVAGYAFEVGFINEPVYVGQRSGLELLVTKADQPVEGLEKTLKAEVVYQDKQMDLPLLAREGQPGAYESIFIPTAAGPYTFHIFGTVEGRSVDERFTSSPSGFNEVQEAASGQFPIQFPTQAELADGAKKGSEAAGQVMIALGLGAGGLVVGLAALGVALAARRRPA